MSAATNSRFARAVVAAAKAQGVERFVYHSVLHPQIEAMPHHWAKMRVEEMLFAAGFDLTILQPTAYMQNILGAWRGIVDDGVFRVPYPVETRLSLVDLDDVAEAAALVLTTRRPWRRDLRTRRHAAAEPDRGRRRDRRRAGTRRSAPKRKPSRPGRRARAPAAWASTNASTLAAMFRYYASHGLVGNPNTLRWLLGRMPNELPHFLRRAVAAQSEI